MYCPKCGKWNEEEDRFCSDCGEELIDNQPAVWKGEKANEAWETVYAFLKKHKKKLCTGLVVLILAVAVIAGGSAIIRHFVGSERVVKQYVEAMLERDWSAMYDTLALPEAESLSREKFVSYMETNAMELPDIARYEVKEAGESDGLIRRYTISYVSTGSSTEQSISLTLVQQAENQLLFFPDYKIATDTMVCEPVITTLPGATVSVDGEMVEGGQENEYGELVVTLPPQFVGEHTISITYPYCKPIETVEYFMQESTTSYTSFELDEETAQQLADTTQQLAQVLYPAAGDEAELANLSLPCALTDEAYAQLNTQYGYMLDSFHGSSTRQISHVTLSQISNTTDMSVIPYDPAGIYFETSFEYDYTETYRSKTNNYSSYGYLGVRYQLIDGTWTVSSIDYMNY